MASALSTSTGGASQAHDHGDCLDAHSAWGLGWARPHLEPGTPQPASDPFSPRRWEKNFFDLNPANRMARYGSPFTVSDFVSHDSKLQVESLNRYPAADHYITCIGQLRTAVECPLSRAIWKRYAHVELFSVRP
jgi:hypothetical protein